MTNCDCADCANGVIRDWIIFYPHKNHDIVSLRRFAIQLKRDIAISENHVKVVKAREPSDSNARLLSIIEDTLKQLRHEQMLLARQL